MFTNTPGYAPIEDLLDHQMVEVPIDGVLAEENDRLFDNVYDYGDGLSDYTDNHQLVDAVVRHESSHARVAKAVGFETVYFAFELDEDNHLAGASIRIGGLTIPKLAYAAIFAAPVDPSTSDIADIHAMGYAGGVNEVAERILVWNRLDSGLHIPVPRSYRSAT